MRKVLTAFLIIISIMNCRLANCDELYRRCLFVSVIQDPPVLSSAKDIKDLVEFSRRAGINNLFVQVYFANKAWFLSKIADPEPYNECLNSVSADPLALLIKEAHASGIKVHAWMNMLSLGGNKDSVFLKKYGVSILTRNTKAKNKLEDYKIDDMFFLEPGDPRVRGELEGIVKELLGAYPDLDGIQFDYIRYPDKEPAYGFTDINIARFKAATGVRMFDSDNQKWKEWKSLQVTDLLKSLSGLSRQIRPGITVSTTGCMPYSRALYEAFQDWPLWIDKGIIDYVTLMSYSPVPEEFNSTIVKAKSKVSDFAKVNIAIGAYKLTCSPEDFKKEFVMTGSSGSGGFAIFHYGSLVECPALGEYLIKTYEDGRMHEKR